MTTYNGPNAGLASDVPTTSRRVLLIEDNADSAESMAMLLELSGYEVEISHMGASGVEAAGRFRPDVVVCDIGLPGAMDGYDVARSLRRDPNVSSAVLVALTGRDGDETKLLIKRAGFDFHLVKPVEFQQLESILKWIDSR